MDQQFRWIKGLIFEFDLGKKGNSPEETVVAPDVTADVVALSPMENVAVMIVIFTLKQSFLSLNTKDVLNKNKMSKFLFSKNNGRLPWWQYLSTIPSKRWRSWSICCYHLRNLKRSNRWQLTVHSRPPDLDNRGHCLCLSSPWRAVRARLKVLNQGCPGKGWLRYYGMQPKSPWILAKTNKMWLEHKFMGRSKEKRTLSG